MTKSGKFDTMSAPRREGGGERSDIGGARATLCEKGERSDLPLDILHFDDGWCQPSFGFLVEFWALSDAYPKQYWRR